MADPVGLIGGAGALRPQTPPGLGGGGPVDPDAPTFKDYLMENLRQVNQLQQDATQAIEDLQTGESVDLEGVLMATQHADMAFRMLLQVRNKMMAAYDEIKQIRV